MTRTRDFSVPHPTLITFSNGNSHSVSDSYQVYKFGVNQKSSLVDATPTSKTDANPCSHQKTIASIIPESIFAYKNGDSAGWMNVTQLAVRLDPYPELPVVNWSEVVSSLADQVDGSLRTRSNLMVTAAEAAKTWRMVTNPFSLMKTDWKRLARNHSASRLAKSGTNLWLEARYGWRPFFSDLKNLSSSFTKVVDVIRRDDDEQASQRKLSERTVLSVTVPPPTILNPEWNTLCDTENSWSTDQGLKCRLVYQQDKSVAVVGGWQDMTAKAAVSPLLRTLQGFGLTTRDILPFLWEVVPYSFCIDWIVNTSGIWSAIDRGNIASAHLQRLCYSVKRTVDYHAEVVFGRPWDLPYVFDKWFGSTFIKGRPGRSVSYTRTVGLPPSSDPVWIEKGISRMHVVDGLVLLSQKYLHRK